MTDGARTSRLRLARTERRLSYESRLCVWLAGLSVPALLLTALVTWHIFASVAVTTGAVLILALSWALASSYFFDLLTRPLKTLSNVVAALREDDYSFRARGARRGDALGDLAFEVNALAATLQIQRTAALDATTLVERVLSAMPSPVVALDEAGMLRLQNAAARFALGLEPQHLGQAAEVLGLDALREIQDQSLYSAPGSTTPWSVRRASFRLHGVPHTLFVLSDVSAALRREERGAFQRLIRVLSHEITNSLTPIQSIAGSLRTRMTTAPSPTQAQDMVRGLTVIEDRAISLGRFLESYQRLARMPEPTLRPVALAPLLQQVIALETRLTPTLVPGPPLTLLCDPDQVQQALINLLRNAADAALAQDETTPAVQLSWLAVDGSVKVTILDNGLGVLSSANLFVPFYTTKPQGSGIGLALAQQIASLHGGTVSLRNVLQGHGCIAELSLPLLPSKGLQLA